MKKIVIAAVAASLAATTLGVATTASAQSRGYADNHRGSTNYGHSQDRPGNGYGHDRDDRRGNGYGHDRDGDRGGYDRDDRRGGGYDRDDRRGGGYGHRARVDRYGYRWEGDGYARWQRAQRQYRAPRYVAPRGYYVRDWSYGQRMPSYYRTRSYVVSDYGRYGLARPPHGCEYVRSGNDVVLTVIATGVIMAVISGMYN